MKVEEVIQGGVKRMERTQKSIRERRIGKFGDPLVEIEYAR
jgi:hypothetical protein